jgi:hypothetical protein
MIKVVCDRCKKIIDYGGYMGVIDIRIKKGYEGELRERNIYDKMQFCLECIAHIKEYIAMEGEEENEILNGNNFLKTGDVVPVQKPKRKYTKRIKAMENETQEDSEPEKEQEAAGTGEHRKDIDIGKVMALHKTGTWNIKEIAEELHADAETIRGIIISERRKARQQEQQEQ